MTGRHLTTIHHQGDWILGAACADHDTDLWFPVSKSTGRKGGPDDTYKATERAAKAICARCPVAADCLAYARANRIDHGIWGGLNTSERDQVTVS